MDNNLPGCKFLYLKPVTYTPDGFNILRLGCVEFNLFTDFLDMNGNSCNVAYRFHIPDLTEQFRLGKYAVRILRKECKKIKFLGRKLRLSADLR